MPDDLQHPSGQPNPNIRVSNAEREQVIAQLHRNTEEGRLELFEFNERAQSVYAAKTYSDLQALMEDLPDGLTPGSSLAHLPGGLDHTPEATSLTLTPKASTVRKQGQWLVPRNIYLKSSSSTVKLDFTEAVIGNREVDIQVEDKASTLILVFPETGMYAVDNVTQKAASVKNLCNSVTAGGVRINITGKLSSSRLIIRRKRRFLWWEY